MLLIGVAFLLAACTSSTAATTTLQFIPPPPNPDGPTTTTTTQPVPSTTAAATVATYDGVLPDGTTYTVFIEGAQEEEVTGFGGVVMFEGQSGPVVAAETQISFLPVEGYSYQGGEYRIPAGGAGSFILEFYDNVLDELGPDAEDVITTSVRGSNHVGLPRLHLEPPFRWLTPEDEVPSHLQVQYETFVVRQGCGELAVACNAFRGIQVIPMEQVVFPARPFEGQNVEIDSPAARPLSDPSYVDYGPLPVVGSPDVLWNGNQLVVWGGLRNDSTPNNMGAVFDPETSEWTIIDVPQIGEGRIYTRAIRFDDLIVIIGPEGTYSAPSPYVDWTQVGPGIDIRPGQPMAVVDGAIYVWNQDGIFELAADGEWSKLPDPGRGTNDNWNSLLLDFGGSLLATATDCLARRTALWTGSEWTDLDPIRFTTCSWGDQVAVVQGELVAWSTEEDPTYIYDAGELAWIPHDPVPLPSIERPSGGLVMDSGLLVPQFDQAAILDLDTRQWTGVRLPGLGISDLMVFTGDEVLMWYPGIDAWRWAPSEGP